MLGCLAVLVCCVFALLLFGFGRAPSARETALLAFAALAAVVSAWLWVPTRHRLWPSVSRLVQGERGVPEQALRVFETRLSRALPLDELLLGLAETLRRTLALSVAEVWIVTDTLLERVASDPARPPAMLVLTAAELRVIARSECLRPRMGDGLAAGHRRRKRPRRPACRADPELRRAARSRRRGAHRRQRAIRRG